MPLITVSVAQPSFKYSNLFFKIKQDIEAGITASALSAYLSADLPELGTITVERFQNIFCACDNAFNWTLTFLTHVGDLSPLIADGSGLSGDGAAISPVTVLQHGSALGGSFALILGNNTDAPRTRGIPFDVTDAGLALILAEDLGLSVYGIRSQVRTSHIYLSIHSHLYSTYIGYRYVCIGIIHVHYTFRSRHAYGCLSMASARR